MSQERQRAWILPMLLAAAQPASSSAPALVPHVEQRSGERALQAAAAPDVFVGPWRLVAELGTGGMGNVYLAESAGDVTRRAAIKVIRPDQVNEVTRARFALEQQAMAQADHEHVARLYDTGQTEQGQPWMAMEFVAGEAITSYCDRRGLDFDARLSLLIDLGETVQHLHERGIRHGDLKPENILVVERAGRAVPKIIDFGLASVRGRAVADEHAVAGSPDYMAPEQFTIPAARIDARAEVFALGIVAHELLTGTLPACDVTHGPDGSFEARLGSRTTVSSRLRGRLARILRRALQQRRDARQASVQELVEELRAHAAAKAQLWHLWPTTVAVLAAGAAGLFAGACALA